MDNLKTLMDKHQYDLVLSLTKDTKDMNYLFYRISAFVALGKGENALDCIKENRHILEGDLSILVKIHIEILCILNRFEEAYEELEYYKGLPYVSQEVEELMHDMPKLIKDEEKKAYLSKQLTNEELKERLLAEEEEYVLPAIDMVRERDISLFLKEIESIMVNYKRQSIRSFALLLCVQKKVDKEMKFNHMGEIIVVNPSKLEPPFIGDGFNHIVRTMQSEFKNPSLCEDAIHLYSSYLIHIYPSVIEETEEMQIEALRQISKEYLRVNDEKTLEDYCADKNLDVDKTKELIQRIKDAIDNF